MLSVNSIFDAFDGLFDELFDGYDEEIYSISFLFMVYYACETSRIFEVRSNTTVAEGRRKR